MPEKSHFYDNYHSVSVSTSYIPHMHNNSMQTMYTYSNINITNSRSTFRSDENGIK